MMRRVMLGWLLALLLVTGSSPIAAAPEICKWYRVMIVTDYYVDGTIIETTYYEWSCKPLAEV
jgi:hypothetical protein